LTDSTSLRDDSSFEAHFELKQLISVGCYGFIYIGANKQTGQDFAIKLESRQCKYTRVLYEARVYKSLVRTHAKASAEKEGLDSSLAVVPRVHWQGVVDRHNVMVMDLLGPSLEDVFAGRNRHFDCDELARLGMKMVDCVEYIHSCGFIHRNIEPANFVLGLANADQLHLIDHGLTKKYWHGKSHEHIAHETDKPFLGNKFFASVNAHAGLQQSRRDDLESVAYVLIYLLKGVLPWMKQSRYSEQRQLARIMKLKTSLSARKLCERLPTQFAEFLRYCRSLSFEEAPNYSHLTELMHQVCAFESGNLETLPDFDDYSYDFVCDWKVHMVKPCASIDARK
jgi:serine/threonine protein kinase